MDIPMNRQKITVVIADDHPRAATDQSGDQRRGAVRPAAKRVHRDTLIAHHRLKGDDSTLRRAAGGKRFPAQLANALARAEFGDHPLRVESVLEQARIAERALNRRDRCRYSGDGQIDRLDRRSGRRADLEGEAGFALDMGLHGAAGEGERVAERGLRRGAIEFVEPRQSGGGTEDARGRRAEEFERGRDGNAQCGDDIDARHQRRQQLASGRFAGRRCAQQRGKYRRHRMRDRLFVHAVIFLRMDLERVDERGIGRCQAHAGSAKYPRRTESAPAFRSAVDLICMGGVATRDPDTQRILEKRARRLTGRG